jgi:hypothetical protein
MEFVNSYRSDRILEEVVERIMRGLDLRAEYGNMGEENLVDYGFE